LQREQLAALLELNPQGTPLMLVRVGRIGKAVIIITGL